MYRDISPIMSKANAGVWDADMQGLYSKEEKNSCGGQQLETTSAAFCLWYLTFALQFNGLHC